MFEDYAKRLEELGANSPKVFKSVALWGAKYAEKTAKNITDKEGLVDTGNYKRNWFAERIEPQKDIYGIILENGSDYASHLEYGHKIIGGGRFKGRFVGKQALNDTEGSVLLKLREEIDILMLQKKHGLSRSEAKKYLK